MAAGIQSSTIASHLRRSASFIAASMVARPRVTELVVDVETDFAGVRMRVDFRTPRAGLASPATGFRDAGEGGGGGGLAKKLGRPQSFASKFEPGERRLDVAEFLDVARALGIDPATTSFGSGTVVLRPSGVRGPRCAA